ncbi:hypothetical protein fh0823_21470 [Francisella halioticida]|nr:hypothetical protein fh0823_21470 [Francisella halioticida]
MPIDKYIYIQLDKKIRFKNFIIHVLKFTIDLIYPELNLALQTCKQ